MHVHTTFMKKFTGNSAERKMKVSKVLSILFWGVIFLQAGFYSERKRICSWKNESKIKMLLSWEPIRTPDGHQCTFYQVSGFGDGPLKSYWRLIENVGTILFRNHSTYALHMLWISFPLYFITKDIWMKVFKQLICSFSASFHPWASFQRWSYWL